MKLYPSLGSKPVQGHVLLYIFCVPVHIHGASPRKAPWDIYGSAVLFQLTEEPFSDTLHCNLDLLSSAHA